MKHDFTSVQNIYIICGKTDMRKGIDGLATLIQDSFELDPYSDSIFLALLFLFYPHFYDNNIIF